MCLYLSDLPLRLSGPNQMVGNINPPPSSSHSSPGVIMSSPEHQRSRTSLHACVCARLFGDWSVIWAARCCTLCVAIHRRRLQMNASIHKYSLSISCSPRLLVVVFSSPLQKKRGKKAIKAGQKRARMQVVYLEKEKKSKRKRCGSVTVCGVVILQQGATLSLFEHSRMNEISSERLSQPLSVGYIFMISLLVYWKYLYFHS